MKIRFVDFEEHFDRVNWMITMKVLNLMDIDDDWRDEKE